MVKQIDLFYTVDSNIDAGENDYCINCNFEMMHKKINELIEIINEMKGNEK